MSQFVFAVTLPNGFVDVIRKSAKNANYETEMFLALMAEQGYALEVKKPNWFSKIFNPTLALRYEVGMVFMEYINKYEVNGYNDGPPALGAFSLISELKYKGEKIDDLFYSNNIPSEICESAEIVSNQIRLYNPDELKWLLSFFKEGGIIQLVDEIDNDNLYSDYGTTKEEIDSYKHEMTEFILKSANEAYDNNLSYGLGVVL